MLCSLFLHSQVVTAILAVRESWMCHTQVPCGLGGGFHRVGNGDIKVMEQWEMLHLEHV